MDGQEWRPSPEGKAASAAHLARIDEDHARRFKRCVVCGQLVVRLDEHGTCSKVSEPHRMHRAEMRTGVRL